MSEPAPGPLRLVQEFVNTHDVDDGREDLQTPADLKAWLLERELIEDEQVHAADVVYARETREALRSMLLANGGATADETAVETVNRAATRAQLTLKFDVDGGSGLKPVARGVDGAIGAILAVAFAAMAEGSWTRLKVCPEETCRVAFYDQSKNRSRRWCSMEVCGNRTKVRAYRQRHLEPT
ncbi:MAG: CGNR zinc finger domain-containing protein [Actinomycetota bacterium]|nr:CGNR zinc finger domain-containing protein [Actinomycetota bacterium]